jgi:phenylacetate-CoA ligase
MFTTMCLNHLTVKGYPLTIVSPGNKPQEILSMLSSLKSACADGNTFSQTILFGYPPFIKGVIDAAAASGLDWEPLNVGLVLAGECYSEAWRHLVAERACIQNPARRVVSLYGTADAVSLSAHP